MRVPRCRAYVIKLSQAPQLLPCPTRFRDGLPPPHTSITNVQLPSPAQKVKPTVVENSPMREQEMESSRSCLPSIHAFIVSNLNPETTLHRSITQYPPNNVPPQTPAVTHHPSHACCHPSPWPHPSASPARRSSAGRWSGRRPQSPSDAQLLSGLGGGRRRHGRPPLQWRNAPVARHTRCFGFGMLTVTDAVACPSQKQFQFQVRLPALFSNTALIASFSMKSGKGMKPNQPHTKRSQTV